MHLRTGNGDILASCVSFHRRVSDTGCMSRKLELRVVFFNIDKRDLY